ncbi:MAG: putative sulfate exporter family transporter [Candidatus Carbobacillus sp.]|nr:putative sulfate exporter family transporter [Candidatus Carbobacillus sp.]
MQQLDHPKPLQQDNKPMPKARSRLSDLWLKEDYWAIWMGLFLMIIALISYGLGGSIKAWALSPPAWTDITTVWEHLSTHWLGYIGLFLIFTFLFTLSSRIMGFSIKTFVPGFIILFIIALFIQVVGNWKVAVDLSLEAPLLALLFGLIVSNFFPIPTWFYDVFRTEYYVKTGIVLLGATLPFTLIIQAGPIAFFQASIISIVTFLTIFWAAVKLFHLDRRFATTLAAGGSICGVSGSIALGSAVKARKEHVSISISLVVVWALIMIFFLPFASRLLGLPPGVAGAWIGTSEFADAAGFAAAAAVGDEAAIQTFTLLKVVGRDIWVGIWALIMAVIATTRWETKNNEKANVMEIWWRFPKFVLGFFIASMILTLVALSLPPEVVKNGLNPLVIAPIKTLRNWTFIFTFLSIGLTTRFRELTASGWKPLAAFTIGVLINVPLGYLMSAVWFKDYWSGF